MALSARRNLVRLQSRKEKLETEFAIPGDSTTESQPFKLDLLPVVSSFTKYLPLRRGSKLPFASMSTSSTTRPKEGKLTSPLKESACMNHIMLGSVSLKILNFFFKHLFEKQTSAQTTRAKAGQGSMQRYFLLLQPARRLLHLVYHRGDWRWGTLPLEQLQGLLLKQVGTAASTRIPMGALD